MNRPLIDTAPIIASTDIVEVIGRYVPLVKNGVEFEACCPFHSESTPSFKVNPAKRFYHCFGCGANGDVIKFLQTHAGMSFVEACKALGADVPGASEDLQRAAGAQDKSQWVPVLPVPENAPPVPLAHIKRGRPDAQWTYRNSAGAVLGYVARFTNSRGGKEVLPLTLCQHSVTGALDWRWVSFPEPRPLFGLDALAKRPDATVLLVEGEKCKEAAEAALLDFVVMSWPGGCKAVKKVDFSPLGGRRVILWPDCDAKRVPLTVEEKAVLKDEAVILAAQASKPLLPEAQQPGWLAMRDIADRLLALECKVWMMRLPEPGSKPDGWDVADAIAEGLEGPALADYVREHSVPTLATLPPPAQACSGGNYVFDAAPAGAGNEDWRGLLVKKDGLVRDCRENVYLILKHHAAWNGVLWVDDFSRKIVRRAPAPWEDVATFKPGVEWDEDDDFRLGLWLSQAEGLLVRNTETLTNAVGWAARERRFHPVEEYLEGLQWDGVSRLDFWLTDYLGVRRSTYSELAGRFFLIGMVARIYQPGCQMRAMPIFEGYQFRGKSSALRVLGGEWFCDTPLDLNNKDAYQLIQGRWLFEIAELDAFNRAESTRIKAFISSPEDRFRAPYERVPRDWKRSTVFCGTTNQDEYFKDQTGNTRYWPLRVEEEEIINLDGLRSVRDLLFAEAVARYKAGERWHPTRDEQLSLFEPEQASREIIDPWEGLIRAWLAKQVSGRVKAVEILVDCLKVECGKIDGARQMTTRIGVAMKRIGWIKKRETGGSREYYYQRPQNDFKGIGG